MSGNLIKQYGVLILSKWPFYCFEVKFPSRMGRTLLVAQTQINGVEVVVATAHLESLNSAEWRGK